MEIEKIKQKWKQKTEYFWGHCKVTEQLRKCQANSK